MADNHSPYGGLMDTRNGYTIGVKEFEVEKGKRGDMINVLGVAGQKIRIARFTIDESEYSFGPAPGDEGKTAPKVEPKLSVAKVPAVRTITLTLTREVAMELLKGLRDAETMLMVKLIDETVEH